MTDIYLEILLGVLVLLALSAAGWALLAFFGWRHSLRRVHGPLPLWTPRQREQSGHHARKRVAQRHELWLQLNDSSPDEIHARQVGSFTVVNGRSHFVDEPPESVAGDKVDEASWQSFPASDAPPWRGRA